MALFQALDLLLLLQGLRQGRAPLLGLRRQLLNQDRLLRQSLLEMDEVRFDDRQLERIEPFQEALRAHLGLTASALLLQLAQRLFGLRLRLERGSQLDLAGFDQRLTVDQNWLELEWLSAHRLFPLTLDASPLLTANRLSPPPRRVRGRCREDRLKLRRRLIERRDFIIVLT